MEKPLARIAAPMVPYHRVAANIWRRAMLEFCCRKTDALGTYLATPQAGTPVIQTTGAGSATWVSAADMMSLMALMLGMFGELIFLILSLWLLFRTTIAFVDSK
jgi:hypothetical protein